MHPVRLRFDNCLIKEMMMMMMMMATPIWPKSSRAPKPHFSSHWLPNVAQIGAYSPNLPRLTKKEAFGSDNRVFALYATQT